MKDFRKAGSWTSLVLGLALFLGGCSGGSSTEPYLYGTLSVSLTDTPADQLDTFQVGIASIDVIKSNTTELHALAGPLVVDLADLRDTGRLVNSLNASVGSYSGVRIVLDMSAAKCLIAGQSSPASIRDDQGLAFSSPVLLTLNIPNYLHLAGAQHALLQVDLDLSQALRIDATSNVVEFLPAAFLRTAAPDLKPVALVGTLDSVDVPNSSFVLTQKDDSGVAISQITCRADGATVFQTDGAPAAGGAGLTALSLLPVGTWIEAQASIDPAQVSVLATSVVAGTGTWDGGDDVIDGHIVDRVGALGADATLTVLGRSSNAAHSAFQYDVSFTVTTTLAGTQVLRQGSATDSDTDALSIGQRVRIFGALSGANMDATAGLVQEHPTWIFGTASGAPAAGQLTLALDSVGLRDELLYNFSAPAAFVTDVGTLADSLGLVAGSNVIERGFLAPAGGGVDFVADAVFDADAAPMQLLVRNRLAAGFALTVGPSTGQIDVVVTGPADPAEAAVLQQDFLGGSILPPSPTPDIRPLGSTGQYLLLDLTLGTSVLYTHFPSFSSALGHEVGLGAGVRHIAATGTWDPVTGTLRSDQVSVLIQ